MVVRVVTCLWRCLAVLLGESVLVFIVVSAVVFGVVLTGLSGVAGLIKNRVRIKMETVNVFFIYYLVGFFDLQANRAVHVGDGASRDFDALAQVLAEEFASAL